MLIFPFLFCIYNTTTTTTIMSSALYTVAWASLPSGHGGMECLISAIDHGEKDEHGGQEVFVEDAYQTVKFCTSGIMDLKLSPQILIHFWWYRCRSCLQAVPRCKTMKCTCICYTLFIFDNHRNILQVFYSFTFK